MADPYLADVKALFHFDAAYPEFDNAGHTTTVTGSLVTASVSGQFGDAMLACANGAYVSITHADMMFPYGDPYTLEARVWVPSSLAVGSTTTYWIAGNTDFALGITLFSGDPNWYFRVRPANGSTYYAVPEGCTVRDAPVHLALSRYSGTSGYELLTFQAGTPGLTLPSGGSPGSTMYFGRLPGSPAFPGYVEELRYTKNVTRYTSAFTPDAAAFDDPVPSPPPDPILSLPLSVTVAAPVTGTLSIALSVTVAAPVTGTLSIALSVAVIPPALLSGASSVGAAGSVAAIWRVIVLVDGVDVYSQLIGDVTIEAEEGAARIAEFTLRPPNGTAINLTQWTGRDVVISVADYSTGAAVNPMRLFTGVIDTPTLNQSSRTIAVRCTDDLQGRCDAMSNAQLLALIGGYESGAVFDPAAAGWDYANDRLATVSASLDISPDGALRLTSWTPASVADMTFDASRVGDLSLSVDIAPRAALINEVNVDYGYRFPRVKAETHALDYESVNISTFAAYLLADNWFMQRAQVRSAIKNAGGEIVSLTFVPLPNYVVAVGSGVFTPSSADLDLCMGFAAGVSFNYAQQQEERYQVRVFNQRSIDAIGVRAESLHGALVGEYPDVTAAENRINAYKDGSSRIPPTDVAPVALEKTTSADVTLTAETNRAASDAALKALIAIAKVKIWASHRKNSVTARVPINPAVDINKTIRINADNVLAQGKCARVKHRLSPETAEAATEFSIALASISGTGITHADTPATAPAGTSAGQTNLTAAVNVVFHSGATEDHQLTITFPAVADAERANAVTTLASEYAAPIYEDLFTITI